MHPTQSYRELEDTKKIESKGLSEVVYNSLTEQISILPVHEALLVTYLKLSNKKLGLLINFNSLLLKDGIRRKINGKSLKNSVSSGSHNLCVEKIKTCHK